MIQNCIYGIPSIWLHSNRLWLEASKCGNYLEINWFEGDHIPPEIESLEETNISNQEMFNKYDEDSGNNIYDTDESDSDDGSDNFWFKNHLEDLIISYSVTLYFLLLFTRFFMIEWFFKNSWARKNLRTVTRGIMGTSQHLRWSSLWHELMALCL